MPKSKLRNRILKIREKNYNESIKISFEKIFNIIKKNKFKLKSIGGYFPINYEIDDVEILREFKKRNFIISLPKTKNNFNMDFYEWSLNEPLVINNYGIPEPNNGKIIYPDILLVPLVAFDKNLYRLGYGGGYYDRYIEKIEKKKLPIKIGLAFSFQKIENIPITIYDKKLDYIVTEQYIL